MAKTLYLMHDEHFDLLAPEDAPEGASSLGTYMVQTPDGEEEREKYLFSAPGNDTLVELPDDYDLNDLTAVTHLIQTLKDRHAENILGIYSPDFPELASMMAPFMRTKHVDEAAYEAHLKTAPAPQEEPSGDAPTAPAPAASTAAPEAPVHPPTAS